MTCGGKKMQTAQQDTTNKYDWLVLNTIQLMRDAKSVNNSEQYWVHFEFAAQLLIPYLDLEIRKRMDLDIAILDKEVSRIKAEQRNDITRKNMINTIRDEFADSHRGFFMPALSKVGITKVQDEALIDFSKLTIDQIADIVRETRSGVVKSVENMEKKKTEEILHEQEKKAVTTETVPTPILSLIQPYLTEKKNEG
jgi:hypothetical protein